MKSVTIKVALVPIFPETPVFPQTAEFLGESPRRGQTIKVKNGYPLIFDISGYTEFLVSSELQQAKEILNTLLRTGVESIRRPIRPLNTRGDAVLAFVAADERTGGGVDQEFGAFLFKSDPSYAILFIGASNGANVVVSI